VVPGAGKPQAFNRYAYTFNNPLKYTDPTGHECQQPDGSTCKKETVSDFGGLSAAEIIERDGYTVDEFGRWVPIQKGQGASDIGYQSYFDQRAISWNGEWGTFSNGREYNPVGSDPSHPQGEAMQWKWGQQAATGKRPSNPWELVKDVVAEVGPEALIGIAGAVAEGKSYPPIKLGSRGGPTAGKPFSDKVQQQAYAENPEGICVYCRMQSDDLRVDHAIPKSRGGNATLDNAQITCVHCNTSKGARDYPMTPPIGYEGPWPPTWWR
jgi:hypothetical protein